MAPLWLPWMRRRGGVAADAPSAHSPAPPEDPRPLADAAMAARRWEEAARLYALVVERQPEDVAAWMQLGHSRKESGDLAGAGEAYARAQALAPWDADIALNIGHLRKVEGDAHAALAAYEQAAALDPGLEDAVLEAQAMRALIAEGRRLPRHALTGAGRLLAAADAARDARQWREAARLYAEYLQAEPEHAEIWVQLGHAEKESGRLAEALSAYRRAVELAPLMADGHVQLGHALKLAGDHEGALAAYARALELDPSRSDAWRELRGYAAQGRALKALSGRPAEGDAAGAAEERPHGGIAPAAAAGAVAFCTIAAVNYLAQVRVLHDSIRRHYPEARFIFCLADGPLPEDAALPETLEVLPAEAIGIPDFPSFAFRYEVTEFCTALKPSLLRLLLGELGFTMVVYLDPDMLVLARAPQLLERLWREAALVLTPHLRRPAGARLPPNDLSIMRAGAFNLGFIAAAQRPEALRLLAWWGEHLAHNCLERPEEGLFVDQRFMDLVPGFSDQVHIERHPGLNLAYWNLPEHRLTRHGEFFEVDGEPLQIMHFSGFDPTRPEILSRHTQMFRPITDPALRALADRYAGLLQAAGYARWSSAPYRYARFASGRPIPRLARRYFADRHASWRGDPFATLEAHLCAPASAQAPRLPRLLEYAWSRDPVLRSVFDVATADGHAAFLSWLERDGAGLLGLDREWLERLLAAAG
ncbi:MAG: tetratricopeptide repeat protein [Rhodovarius sp.]|nr:tetratricopeptide repeat protein [Rhodovarius sp.]MDW8313456.1 tetratricopeptide repeat protein [Rhodovarius sp.]